MAGYSSRVTLTRTSDTNAYTANDVLGAATGSTAALTFTDLGPDVPHEIMVTTTKLLIRDTGVISGETSYRLYLYRVTPPSALGDNAAFDIPSGDRASLMGYLDLGTPVDLVSSLYVMTAQQNVQLSLSGSSMYGYLVTNGGYTPSSARVLDITLHATDIV